MAAAVIVCVIIGSRLTNWVVKQVGGEPLAIAKIAEEEDAPLNKDSINQIFANSNAATIDNYEKKKDH